MVSKQSIEELQKIILEEYGRKLDFNQVSEIANGLVGYFDLLAKINYRIEQNHDKDKDHEN